LWKSRPIIFFWAIRSRNGSGSVSESSSVSVAGVASASDHAGVVDVGVVGFAPGPAWDAGVEPASASLVSPPSPAVSATLEGLPGSVKDEDQCAFTHAGSGLAKSQIWLLEWIKVRLKSIEEAKDEDHLPLLKELEEDFRWITLVACEQGRLVVDEKDIRAISVVACEGGRWEVDEEEDDRKVAWLIGLKEELRMMVKWPGSKGMMKGKMISL
jgi:hypothetical protein